MCHQVGPPGCLKNKLHKIHCTDLASHVLRRTKCNLLTYAVEGPARPAPASCRAALDSIPSAVDRDVQSRMPQCFSAPLPAILHSWYSKHLYPPPQPHADLWCPLCRWPGFQLGGVILQLPYLTPVYLGNGFFFTAAVSCLREQIPHYFLGWSFPLRLLSFLLPLPDKTRHTLTLEFHINRISSINMSKILHEA